MLWLFFSHINGDIETFKKLLGLSEFKKADIRVCLGDIIKFGSTTEGQDTIRLVRETTDYVLKGLRDKEYLIDGQTTKDRTFGKIFRDMFSENTSFLRSAPTILTLEKCGFIFTNFRLNIHSEHEKRVWDDKEVLEEFGITFKEREYSGAKFIFSGYSIVPSAFEYLFLSAIFRALLKFEPSQSTSKNLHVSED